MKKVSFIHIYINQFVSYILLSFPSSEMSSHWQWLLDSIMPKDIGHTVKQKTQKYYGTIEVKGEPKQFNIRP